MNRLSVILIFLLCGLLRAAEVPLTGVPATDSRWFWTYDGYREPLANRNLSGNPISIGGRVFDEGICGHTPFSMVFNLDGTAEAFTSLAGLEDEDHPKDAQWRDGGELSIFLVVRVDRKEVFRREARFGAPPVPVEIDLRGKHQIELCAESGKGPSSHRHRVAFGNPRFRTPDPAKLRATLDSARKSRDADLRRTPVPPPLPAWKTVRISATDGLLQVDNGLCELVLAPASGGRLLAFSRRGGSNPVAAPLPHDPRLVLQHGRAPDFGGGHFLRLLPRDGFLPGDPMLEHAAYEAEFPAEGVVVLRSAVSRVTLTTSEYRFELPPGTDRLTIVNTVVNRAPFARELGVWSLTRADRERARRISLPGVNSPAAPLRLSGKADLLAPKFLPEGLSCTPARPGCEGFAELVAPSPEMALSLEFGAGERLHLSYEQRETEFLQLYLTGTLLELEGVGEIRVTPPGGRISLTEVWRIAPPGRD